MHSVAKSCFSGEECYYLGDPYIKYYKYIGRYVLPESWQWSLTRYYLVFSVVGISKP